MDHQAFEKRLQIQRDQNKKKKKQISKEINISKKRRKYKNTSIILREIQDNSSFI